MQLKPTDVNLVRSMLRGMGERMLGLAEKLSDKGQSLDAQDKEVIRFAIAPVLKECLDMTFSAYLLGNRDWQDSNITRLMELLEVTS